MRILKTLCVLFFLLLLGFGKLGAQEAYAWLDGTTLKFFYDANRPMGAGVVTYTLPRTPTSTWEATSVPSTVTAVEFDASFARFTGLKTVAGYFAGFTNLREVINIQNLNVQNINDYSNLFRNCSSLVSLDLTGFKPGSNAIVNNMFQGCTSLSTIICGETWTTSSSSMGMFTGCTALKGAIAYASNKVNVAYANPTTGYFSLPVNINVSSAGYATYYNSKAVKLSSGLKAYTIDAVSDRVVNMNGRYDGDGENNIVPGGTAVLLQAQQGAYTLLTIGTNTTQAPTGNLLRGSDVEGMTTGGGVYYKLTYNNAGDKFGFFWGAADGGAFTNPAHKAYLVLNNAQGAKFSGFALDDEKVTTVESIAVNTENSSNNKIYNMLGQEVHNPAKGVFIVNGRKVLMK